MTIAQREKLRKYEATYRKNHPDKYREKSRNYQRRKWAERPEFARKYQRDYRKKIREELVIAYGGKCNCCGEAKIEFLALDHINNDGNIQRKEIGSGIKFYLYLKRTTPKDIQVLCHNCNLAKKNYGKCPHQN